MKEVIMKVPSFSADYPKAPIYVAELVRCGECIYWKNSLCQAWHRVIPKDGYCSIGERDGSTQTETQNSNLTFKTLEYCNICDHKGCEECISNALDEHCIPSQFKKQIEDECAKEYEELGLKELKELIEADRKTEPNSSEKPNNCEYAENPSGDVWECGCFLDTYCEHQIYDRNPDGTINIVECGYEPKDEPQTMLNDGTLVINVEDATKVSRVLVGDDKNRGDLYYPDDEDEPQTEETEMERLERIDNEIEDAWARIRELTDETQTDCPWK